MQSPSASDTNARERLWRTLFFCFSAVMAGFALVELDAGRPAGAAGDAGVSCLMLSLLNQFPVIRAIVGAASKARMNSDREPFSLPAAHDHDSSLTEALLSSSQNSQSSQVRASYWCV